MNFNPEYTGGIMSEKNVKAPPYLRLLPAPVVCSAVPEPAAPEKDIRQNAEAILNILTYIEREAHIYNFVELSLILGIAHISATELVQSFNEE